MRRHIEEFVTKAPFLALATGAIVFFIGRKIIRRRPGGHSNPGETAVAQSAS